MKLYEKMNSGVYVIAEMSANHAGKIENAFKIIEEAAKAGADCVKIQTYTADTLTIDCREEPYQIKGGLWDGYNYYQLYQAAYTPWEWQRALRDKCREAGVDFLSTPFDRTAVDFLEELRVPMHKVASFELVDIPLLEKVGRTRKGILCCALLLVILCSKIIIAEQLCRFGSCLGNLLQGFPGLFRLRFRPGDDDVELIGHLLHIQRR